MADVALVNCVLGLSGRVEYMSAGSILLTRSGEFAKIATSLIENAKSSKTCENNGPSQPPTQQLDGTDEFHHAPNPGGNHLEISTVDSPFLQTQSGNAMGDMSEFVPYMTDQFQTLNWLDWNFVQNIF